MTPSIRRIYERRARAAGLTLEQWTERNEAVAVEQRATEAIIYSRTLQRAAITRWARSYGRTFEVIRAAVHQHQDIA